jgi:hypothetical protein
MQQAALSVGGFQLAAQFADARVLAGQRLLDHLGAVLRVVEESVEVNKAQRAVAALIVVLFQLPQQFHELCPW